MKDGGGRGVFEKRNGFKLFQQQCSDQPSLSDLPIVMIPAWQGSTLKSPQFVTFDSFLANFNNANSSGGGDGELDLDSGVYTC